MINRRKLLGTTAALAVTAGIAACSSGGNGGGGGGGAGGTTGDVTPTYTEFDKVKIDLPGDPELGIPNGYYGFPDSPPKITDYPLPKTDPITVLSQGAPPPMPMDKSPRFKALCEDVGNDLDVTRILSDQYSEKFQTLIAGDQLPDLLMLVGSPELPKLLEAKFTDLGEFIGGDKVSKYPGLASIPTTAWAVSTLNGQLWGIPQPRPPAGTIMSSRGDLLEPKGIDKDQSPADGAELLALMKEMTDAKNNQFAMGAQPSAWLFGVMLEMVDAPNGWTEEGGKFTADFESPQYKDAINHTKEFWDAGVLHPNSFSEPGNNSVWWQGGVTQVYIQGFTNWLYFTMRQPEFNMGMIEIPKWDGGGLANKHRSAPAYGAYAAISKQDSPERVEEILRVVDYFAAPYGTEEYLRMNYGLPGEHYKMEDHVPVATEAVVDEPTIMTYFGSQSLSDITGPRDLVDAQSAYLKKIMPTSKANPTEGLYSDTSASKGAGFSRDLTAMIGEVILGRKKMADFDALVSKWQDGIGKDIKAEYEEAKQQAG